MKIDKFEFPDELYYDQNHFWARVEGDVVTMGATHFTTELAGEITFVDVPEEGDDVTQGKPFGSLESGKWVGRLYAVVSGEIVEANEDLEDEPEVINEEPYGQGWICKIEMSDKAELGNLMQGAAMEKFIKAEMERLADKIK
ncbi:MAG: glycine cleavage system protein GcvH [Proteobacteria bacterium]|nr:glycine cleavage system protein GcvH [Pseudomonadota bacterium]